MRAATAIVGAVAAASIFVALAFIIPGGGSSPTAITKTVTEQVEARAPAGGGGPTQCDGGKFTVEGTSCEIGAEIHDQYVASGPGQLVAVGVHETISMTCTEAAPVECKGPGGAVVYFAP